MEVNSQTRAEASTQDAQIAFAKLMEDAKHGSKVPFLPGVQVFNSTAPDGAVKTVAADNVILVKTDIKGHDYYTAAFYNDYQQLNANSSNFSGDLQYCIDYEALPNFSPKDTTIDYAHMKDGYLVSEKPGGSEAPTEIAVLTNKLPGLPGATP
jgi:hypothetical protein